MPTERMIILGYEAQRGIAEERSEKNERLAEGLKVIKHFFDVNNAHANIELYKAVKKQEELKVLEEELKPEDVPEEFKKLDEMGLSELFVEEIEEEQPEETPLPPDMEELLKGGGFAEFTAAFLTDTVDLADVDLEEE